MKCVALKLGFECLTYFSSEEHGPVNRVLSSKRIQTLIGFSSDPKDRCG